MDIINLKFTNMVRSIFIFISFWLILSGCTSRVDITGIYSESMNREINAIVITPDNYNPDKVKYPVVYLLHGYSGNFLTWIENVPDLRELVDLYDIIVVCPDGGYSSWYFDSPVDEEYKYDTHVAGEIVDFIDENYSTIQNRKGRAITGHSMGGHGALYLAFRHQDIFGAAGSQSGGVDIRPFPDNWEISEILGEYEDYPDNWEKNTVINMTDLLKSDSLAIIIDCGTDDFFYTVNKNLHNRLTELNIPHEYIERPGGHDWEYWNMSIKDHLIFFNEYFRHSNTE